MLLITFGGYMLYDDDGDGLMDMPCCLLHSVGICWIGQRWHTLVWEQLRFVLATEATKNGKAIPSGRQANYKVYSFARHYPWTRETNLMKGDKLILRFSGSLEFPLEFQYLFRCGCLVDFRRFSLMFVGFRCTLLTVVYKTAPSYIYSPLYINTPLYEFICVCRLSF